MNDGPLKSQEFLQLTLTLIEDVYRLHQLDQKNLERDKNYVSKRFRNEGLSFLTQTLPDLSSQLIEALESGQLCSSRSFKKIKRGSNLPCFMHRFFSCVFDEKGVLLPHSDAEAIASLRQCLEVHKKLRGVCTVDERKLEADYISEDMSLFSGKLESSQQMSDLYYAKICIKEIFNGFSIDRIRFGPFNGPGSTTLAEKSWEKFQPKFLFTELDDLFPYDSIYRLHTGTNDSTYANLIRLPFSVKDEIKKRKPACVSRLCFVPKTVKKMRTIAIEPKEKMVYQQCMRKYLYTLIEHNSKGKINFVDQSVNQNLVVEGSLDKNTSTIDLSSASDRVALEHVLMLFEDEKELLNYLLRSRTFLIKLPSGRLYKLKKYASQGNALTFPVEAVIFYSLLQGRYYALHGHFSNKIYVYGDDIIVPTHFNTDAYQVLESFGFKINSEKSYSRGFFRESCGMDAYKGIDVTPILHKNPINGRLPKDIASILALSDNFFLKGYWKTASKIVEKLPFQFRKGYKLFDEGYLLPSYFTRKLEPERWNSDLQRSETRVFVLRSRRKIVNNDFTYIDWHIRRNSSDLYDPIWNPPPEEFCYTPRDSVFKTKSWVEC